MKTTLATLVLASFACTGVQAAGGYLGASIGVMDNSVGGFDDATNVGVLAGYDFYNQDSLAFSVEGELTTTASNGDVRIAGYSGSWDIDTQAVYVAARVGNPFYVKARYGVLREDASVKAAGISASGSDSGVSWGASVGWMVTPALGLQVDGTLIEGDVNYWNAGLIYRFQ